MPDLALTDRLQPVLLDRLLDNERSSAVEGRDKRVMSMSQIRQSILRDLEYLLNTTARPEGDEIYKYPLASRSVLNFGTAPFSGRTTSEQSRERLRASVERAIGDFEPRLLAGTVKVRRGVMKDARGKELGAETVGASFEVSGDVHPLPMPDSLFVRTEVDLEVNRWVLSATVGQGDGGAGGGS